MQAKPAVAELEDVPVGLDHLVRVRRPNDRQAWNGPQRDELLDRLMGRSVLAVTHGIMREYKDGWQLHDCR